MEKTTISQTQGEETGLKSLTSPSNHNHSSMINRFNIPPQKSSSSCTSQSSLVSISPCSSYYYSSSSDSVDDVLVSTYETRVTNHHHKQEEEEEITEKPFVDHRKNVTIGRNQRSGLKREFPPPIPLLARIKNLPCHMPWVLKRSYTDGRLVIREVNIKYYDQS